MNDETVDIDISDLDKAEVLAALYNRAQPQGMGMLHYDPIPMDAKEAQEILDSGSHYFDYLKGRVMKVNLGADTFSSRLYNRDNGAGAAEQVILKLREEK